jgi:hypothetical protein
MYSSRLSSRTRPSVSDGVRICLFSSGPKGRVEISMSMLDSFVPTLCSYQKIAFLEQIQKLLDRDSRMTNERAKSSNR